MCLYFPVYRNERRTVLQLKTFKTLTVLLFSSAFSCRYNFFLFLYFYRFIFLFLSLVIFFLIDCWLLYNIGLISVIYQHELAIGVHMFPSFLNLPRYNLNSAADNRSSGSSCSEQLQLTEALTFHAHTREIYWLNEGFCFYHCHRWMIPSDLHNQAGLAHLNNLFQRRRLRICLLWQGAELIHS